MNQTTPLTRLARGILDSEARTNEMKRRISEGDRLPLGSLAHSERAEDFAREAFAIACGHRIGTADNARALAEALAEQPPRLDETAAIFEFVGQYDSLAPGNQVSIDQLRESAHAFARNRGRA